MRHIPLATLTLVSLTLLSGSAFARSDASLRPPAEVKPFLLRASEPAAHEFPRTPSFSWRPVKGAARYEFQLAKSPSFSEGSIFWSAAQVKGPAVAVPLALPWMTGNPYATYARVRAVTSRGITAWSSPYGFNIRWRDVPRQLPGYPGLSRWTTVEGATGYDVWFTRLGVGGSWTKTVSTRTNAVDHREAYAFHSDPAWTGEVRWRVRAVRALYGSIPTALPAVTYGPWSREYVSTNSPLSGPLTTLAAVTNGATSKRGTARVHELTPAFAFTGDASLVDPIGQQYGLHRVYVFSDSDCVNVIFRGAITGAPAYAPRTTGPLNLPKNLTDLAQASTKVLGDGLEGDKTYMADNSKLRTTESDPGPTATGGAQGSGSQSGSPSGGSQSSAGDSGTSSGDTGNGLPETPKVTGAPVDLWESGWPNGRFYWTVVPVSVLTTEDGNSIQYREVIQPQDACQAGNVVAFGKDSSPVVAGQGTPYASGLSPKGRLVATVGSTSSFYGNPLIAWRPVQGASQYQIEWSRAKYPWRKAGEQLTYGTAATLPLTPGTWWYRVRGINFFLPGTAKAMGWSSPLRVTVAKPRFAVSGGS